VISCHSFAITMGRFSIKLTRTSPITVTGI
jgi:hypothetical protein